MHLTERALRADTAADARARAGAVAARVDALCHLTVAVAGHPHVRELLAMPDGFAGSALARRTDAWLESVATASGASILYVIDATGLTRAASNFARDDSLVGNTYTWRPYFQDAMAGAEARYYAMGTATLQAGYFFARPVEVDGATLGVAVVKVDLESIQSEWERGTEALLLVDEHGVAIVASEARWRFRSVAPLDGTLVTELNAARKYGDGPFAPLAVSAPMLSAPSFELDGTRWLAARAPLPAQGWTLLTLAPMSPVRNAALLTAAATLLLIVLSVLVALYRRERVRRAALDAEARDAVRVRGLNRQLEAEIAERRRAETELGEMQNELVQTSKLAALGQMSAAVAHEVNQPLSAIRTYAASARLLLERGRESEVGANLDEIETLTERLALVTSELKVFARRPDEVRDPVDLAHCIERVRVQLGSTLEESGTQLVVHLPEEAAYALGSDVRVEQVISNLARNAIDAAADSLDGPRVDLSLGLDGDEVVLRVADNGEGLDDEALEHLFDPFFTTKPVGQGVGLGLAISYGIVQEMGGRLRVRNLDDGGALFSLRLARHLPRDPGS